MAQNTIPLKAPITKKFEFGPWKLTSTKCHILTSEGQERKSFENALELPQVPEMVFAENILRLEHSGGFGVEFNALDALKQVEAHDDPLKVAAAKVWQEARSECEHIKNVVKPFDWTFTTDYKGTVFGDLKVESTEERIDLEKLKKREEILFYDDFLLFEDELSDNGSSMLNCKIRVMPSSFFILLRFYMRVDDVIVRVNDTRLYYECCQLQRWDDMARIKRALRGVSDSEDRTCFFIGCSELRPYGMKLTKYEQKFGPILIRLDL